VVSRRPAIQIVLSGDRPGRVTLVSERRPQVLKGFRDFLPAQMMLRQQIVGRFREVFERHGFEPLDTPTLEYLEVLTGKAGENEKLMYHFADHGGRQVGLRYDLTVPLARVVAMHQHELVLPFKRYHIAPVWRAENTQRGRSREFWQCDADVVGSGAAAADAEVVAVLAEALAAVGLPGFVIHVNHRRLLEAIGRAAGVAEAAAGTLYRSLDKLDKIGAEGVRRDLEAAGIAADAAGRVLETIALDGEPRAVLAELRTTLAEVPGAGEAIGELDALFALLPDFGVPADRYRLDLALARGLDYYTGPVYEAKVVEPKVGSVAGAGRYDGLIGAFLGRTVPATGISLGLERIVEVVLEHGLMAAPTTVAEVFVASFPETVGEAARIAGRLRAGGLRVDLSLLSHRGIGEQLRYAGRKGIPVAVIAGGAELAAGKAALKDLGTGEQATYPLDEIVTAARSLLRRVDSGDGAAGARAVATPGGG
jgi:histidyl-tRNA synthetase